MCTCSYLHQFIQHHSIKTGQVLHIVSLHHGTVLPDVSPELLHVEDQLCYVPEKHTKPRLCYSRCEHTPGGVFVRVCVFLLVYEVVCAFLLDVVCVSKQPDDLVTGKRQRHEHK